MEGVAFGGFHQEESHITLLHPQPLVANHIVLAARAHLVSLGFSVPDASNRGTPGNSSSSLMKCWRVPDVPDCPLAIRKEIPYHPKNAGIRLASPKLTLVTP